MRKLALILIFLCTIIATQGASNPGNTKNGDFGWTTVTRIGSTGPIEQQPGVVYSGSCLWTIDSLNQFSGVGNLPAATTVSTGDCLIADNAQHITGINFTTSSADLIVKITYQPQGVVFTIPARQTSSGYQYIGCGIGPVYSTVDLLPPVPDSNTGRGIKTTITISVQNPTNRSIKKFSTFAVIGSNEPTRQPICGGLISDWFTSGNDDAAWKT